MAEPFMDRRSRACCSAIFFAMCSARPVRMSAASMASAAPAPCRSTGRRPAPCVTLAVQAEGADIRTVEGLAPAADRLSPLQEAFREHFGLQCGFCTSGFLMSLDALLRERPQATEPEIREFLSGHLCRCTGYGSIVKAAVAAARKEREERGHA